MILVIACGNPLRQDDGAGLRLAEALATARHTAVCPIRLITVHQLTPELALDIAQPHVSEVWFVDTRVARGSLDTALEIRAIEPLPDSPSLGHHLSPELLLLYAQKLFAAPQAVRARQITIPGFQFGHGDELSEPCEAILEQAMPSLRDEAQCGSPIHF